MDLRCKFGNSKVAQNAVIGRLMNQDLQVQHMYDHGQTETGSSCVGVVTAVHIAQEHRLTIPPEISFSWVRAILEKYIPSTFKSKFWQYQQGFTNSQLENVDGEVQYLVYTTASPNFLTNQSLLKKQDKHFQGYQIPVFVDAHHAMSPVPNQHPWPLKDCRCSNCSFVLADRANRHLRMIERMWVQSDCRSAMAKNFLI